MKYTYKELWEAYQNLLRENAVLNREIQRLKGGNAGVTAGCGTLFREEQPDVRLSLEEKVALFRSLFRGREDVFARRWYSRTSDKSGYQPVCLNEWNRAFCDKKKFKCAECPRRQFKALSYEDVYKHLEGKHPEGCDVIGAYAILPDNTCCFLCADFDDKSCVHGYQTDVPAVKARKLGFVGSCHGAECEVDFQVLRPFIPESGLSPGGWIGEPGCFAFAGASP